jgi:hypothetical protein
MRRRVLNRGNGLYQLVLEWPAGPEAPDLQYEQVFTTMMTDLVCGIVIGEKDCPVTLTIVKPTQAEIEVISTGGGGWGNKKGASLSTDALDA